MSVKDFVNRWRVVDGERANYQKFWLTLIRDLFGVDKPENFIQFEVPVQLEHRSFIDGYFPDSKVIVEQKNFGVDLEKEITQSDGSKLTPHEQAKRYGDNLPYSMRPRWIVVCNFREFLIYDMETLEPPTKILLTELPEKFHALDFLVDETQNKIRVELELSLKAGEIVGKLYDALRAQYLNPDSPASLVSLNKLCVRLVFCLFAESSGIFGKHKIFRDWLSGARNIRQDLILLFETLDTPVDERDPYLDDALKKFPFVNGGLFHGAIEIPNFTDEIKNLLFEEASSGFNWSGISPTIFGAVFESTLNAETRRTGGMHYTSVENIHKVIDPLFLDELKAEFAEAKTKKQLAAFHEKISAIKIFDPACGSGNFLTESFISLRRLENEVLKKILGEKIILGAFDNPVKVSIAQFFGVEINDFAVAVAQTALWIAELQMIKETQEIIHRDLDFLPLKSYSNIHEANALELDWREVISPDDVNFIIGNPPFVGARLMTKIQKRELQKVFGGLKGAGNLDYVAGWLRKAADFMAGKNSRAAFVATNSVSQGDTVSLLWKNLFDSGVHIDFGYSTFRWDSESTQIAHVHCVIVGFSCAPNDKPKLLFLPDQIIRAKNINGYLLDAPNIFVWSREEPVSPDTPPITKGFQATDGRNLILSPEERADMIKRDPAAEKFIRRYSMGNEFINGLLRYCLWLVDAMPNEIKKIKPIYERVKACRDWRSAQKPTGDAFKLKDTPHLFRPCRQFRDAKFICVPLVSSEKRRYIPMGFVDDGMIPGNNLFAIYDATPYHFGILTSSVHMTWMRTVCGRLKSDYRYSKDIVYNNFIWPDVTEKQRAEISATAQKILDVRAKYPDATYADLYDEYSMPSDLRAAHKKNDLAVAKLYGWEKLLDNEPAMVIELLKLYERRTSSDA